MLRLIGRPCPTPRQLFQRFTPAAIESTSSVILDGAVGSSSINSSTRTIFSTSSAWKGRKGGSSVLRPRPTRPTRTRVAGAGKKNKPKMHGAPFSRIAKDKKIQEKGERDLEAMKSVKLPEGIPYEF